MNGEATFDPNSLSPELKSAIGAVAAIAGKKYGSNPGYQCLLALLPYRRVISYLGLSGEPPETSGVQFGQALASELKTHGLLPALIDMVLESAQLQQGEQAWIAKPILTQMNADRQRSQVYRRPVQYLVPTSTCFATALAIDEQFWTRNW